MSDDYETWRKKVVQLRSNRIRSGAAFVANFQPPDWLIDGVIQNSRLYACTSLTAHGKTAVWLYCACMIHAGRSIGPLKVTKGNVLILAGENPEDLKARMIGMAREFEIPTDQLPFVLPGNFPLTEEEAESLIQEIRALDINLALIIGDTAASFFPGDDENDNVTAGLYARTLRLLTECSGHPAVVVLCHPVKNASPTNLLPRGGGAFLNELDGNLTLWSTAIGDTTTLHWQGKIRGPDFPPFAWKLRSVSTGRKDREARDVLTIVAEPLSDEAAADHAKQAIANDDAVLSIVRDNPEWSWANIANHLGWITQDGRPARWLVQRAFARLSADGLLHKPRAGGRSQITDKGLRILKSGKSDAYEE